MQENYNMLCTSMASNLLTRLAEFILVVILVTFSHKNKQTNKQTNLKTKKQKQFLYFNYAVSVATLGVLENYFLMGCVA